MTGVKHVPNQSIVFTQLYGYWAKHLDMDIVAAKREIEHLIAMRDDTLPFLDALHNSGREVVLVTNAHPGKVARE